GAGTKTCRTGRGRRRRGGGAGRGGRTPGAGSRAGGRAPPAGQPWSAPAARSPVAGAAARRVAGSPRQSIGHDLAGRRGTRCPGDRVSGVVTGVVETGRDAPGLVRRGERPGAAGLGVAKRLSRAGAAETAPGQLITQRSRVQIPPPLQICWSEAFRLEDLFRVTIL